MKILVDINLSPLWIPFLTGEGFTAIHWSQVGKATAADAEILDYAAAGSFVILTHDLDFGTLLAKRRAGARVSFKCALKMCFPSLPAALWSMHCMPPANTFRLAHW